MISCNLDSSVAWPTTFSWVCWNVFCRALFWFCILSSSFWSVSNWCCRCSHSFSFRQILSNSFWLIFSCSLRFIRFCPLETDLSELSSLICWQISSHSSCDSYFSFCNTGNTSPRYRCSASRRAFSVFNRLYAASCCLTSFSSVSSKPSARGWCAA